MNIAIILHLGEALGVDCFGGIPPPDDTVIQIFIKLMALEKQVLRLPVESGACSVIFLPGSLVALAQRYGLL